MPYSLILTHPGSSHKDEFLACCVLLADHRVPIVRREPTAGELADPGVAVVDVGNQHDPEVENFDHHQFPKDHPPACSLSLVLQNLGLYEDARAFCDWLKLKAIQVAPRSSGSSIPTAGAAATAYRGITTTRCWISPASATARMCISPTPGDLWQRPPPPTPGGSKSFSG